MTEEEARELLDRINVLRAACSELHLLVAQIQQLQLETEIAMREEELPELPSGMVLH